MLTPFVLIFEGHYLGHFMELFKDQNFFQFWQENQNLNTRPRIELLCVGKSIKRDTVLYIFNLGHFMAVFRRTLLLLNLSSGKKTLTHARA